MPEHATIRVSSAGVAQTAQNTTVTQEGPDRLDSGHVTLRAQVSSEGVPTKEPAVLTTDPRPEWLPAKYKTVQDLLKSQEEAERKITAQGQELAALKKGATTSSTPTTQTTTATTPAAAPDAASVLASSQAQGTTPSQAAPSASPAPAQSQSRPGLDPAWITALGAEFITNGGKLTPASIAKLEEAGIPQSLVADFVAGQEARAQLNAQAIAEIAGGRKQLENILDYTGKYNIEAANAYNKAFVEGRMDDLKAILRGMRATYEDRLGRDPRILTKGEVVAGAEQEAPFMSWAEATAAQSDPRYKRGDRAFIRSTERRIINSPVLNPRGNRA